MIRPLTIFTFLLACGSGLFLYQSKHDVQVLDRTIEKTVHDTGALREQSRLLAAEWTMLNDPDRLRQLSDQYLSLKPINPSQFTSLADLAGRLPPPRTEAPPAEDTPIAIATTPRPENEPGPAAADTAAPPAAVAIQRAEPRPLDTRPPELKQAELKPGELKPGEPKPGEARPADPRLAETRPTETRPTEPRPAEPRPDAAPGFAPPLSRPASVAARPADPRQGDPRLAETRPAAPHPDPIHPEAATRQALAEVHLPPQRPLQETYATPTSTPAAPATPAPATAASAPRPVVLAAPRPQPANPPAYAQSARATPHQTPYGQAPYGQAPYGQRPYGQQPYGQPPYAAASAPYTGSLLGAAHGSQTPAPRPTPVYATYNNN